MEIFRNIITNKVKTESTDHHEDRTTKTKHQLKVLLKKYILTLVVSF